MRYHDTGKYREWMGDGSEREQRKMLDTTGRDLRWSSERPETEIRDTSGQLEENLKGN